MEIQPAPFPVKSKYSKPKSSGKNMAQESKQEPKVLPPLQRKKRVFGTIRNPNIPVNPALERPKPKPKASLGKSQLLEHDKPISKKKSVSFKEIASDTVWVDGSVIDLKTPVRTPLISRLSSTPYRTAERCSKCRYDRLETSAYWLGQINQAESVGKHFVAASFFQLAFMCKAEPFGNIKMELKKYLGRHEHLNGEEEWRNLSICYKLVKQEGGLLEEAGLVEEGAVVKGQEDEDQLRENTCENGSRLIEVEANVID